jgi:acyl-CoA hydrolase
MIPLEKAKPVKASALEIARLMMPMDANTQGNVYGGSILRLVDEIAGVVAARHARCNVVTASLDRMDFLSPVYLGNLLILKAAVNFVGHTSMEVGVKIETEDLRSGERTHTGTAYLTFVALDKNGKPKVIPQVIPQTAAEKERFREGNLRRALRMRDLERKRLKRTRGEA